MVDIDESASGNRSGNSLRLENVEHSLFITSEAYYFIARGRNATGESRSVPVLSEDSTRGIWIHSRSSDLGLPWQSLAATSTRDGGFNASAIEVLWDH